MLNPKALNLLFLQCKLKSNEKMPCKKCHANKPTCTQVARCGALCSGVLSGRALVGGLDLPRDELRVLDAAPRQVHHIAHARVAERRFAQVQQPALHSRTCHGQNVWWLSSCDCKCICPDSEGEPAPATYPYFSSMMVSSQANERACIAFPAGVHAQYQTHLLYVHWFAVSERTVLDNLQWFLLTTIQPAHFKNPCCERPSLQATRKVLGCV